MFQEQGMQGSRTSVMIALAYDYDEKGIQTYISHRLMVLLLLL